MGWDYRIDHIRKNIVSGILVYVINYAKTSVL